MFDKVLVANRGEIACRVMRTLARLGVHSVAVYSEADRNALHVRMADESICVGPPEALKSYLNVDAILDAAERTRAEAIHPGYGFLSENADFAESAERQGVSFIGPTPESLRRFGVKHGARALARELGIPMLPGTELLPDAEAASRGARLIGCPVMLKSTAGGGGIGMQVCWSPERAAQAFDSVSSLGAKNFKDGGVFLEKYVERARHIEVQLFGDGNGTVVALGERDCSAQRRHQKVVEETPAPGISEETRARLFDAAVLLGRAVNYRSAGTVEFVYDADSAEFYFLEVNTRLQVEHGVTELVTGLDLVEWMVRLSAGETLPLANYRHEPRGHAVEVRIYAEDPAREFKPSAGTLTDVAFPDDARVDGWVERGTEVSPFYDPLLAKILVHADDRDKALGALETALDATRLAGIETNLGYLRRLASDPVTRAGAITTSYLGTLSYAAPSFEVLAAGTQSTVQDYPGRLGYWDVGIPPSGPMDMLAFRLANRIVGNVASAAGLELTVSGPTLRFACDTTIALTGAQMQALLDDVAVPYFEPVRVGRGQLLKLGKIEGPGCRTYLAVRHGIDVPSYLGSAATFTLGGFGGHGGRALRAGDVLRLHENGGTEASPRALAAPLRPSLGRAWQIGVLYGPHGAPDFFTARDISTFFETAWQVHYNSARSGVRLIGPKPEWARADGGEAGLHPSNIHDNAYAIGTVDFTGDMPIILGPDGPSLGGFVCPATIVAAELWKIGQLKPGDEVRFVPLDAERAAALEAEQDEFIRSLEVPHAPRLTPAALTRAVVHELEGSEKRPNVRYRPCGDKYLLVEYGPLVLDLGLRFRVQALMQWLEQNRPSGIIDLTPGIRSLQVHYDSRSLPLKRLLELLARAEKELPAAEDLVVPTRIVRLPLSWDDPATRLAIEKYVQGVRKDAPWTPSNLEFIRRINGLSAIADVKRTVFDASYLVLGLGDVYLGAPVATPLDPRHRLVTTKYNPARTWTPENAVGIGGAYLCIYGMEGPGGYQFVGRTLQVYNRYRQTRVFEAGKPWLLRFFDQIRFYEVSARELLEMREAFLHGRCDVEISEERFSLRDYRRFLAQNEGSIAAFKQRQQSAFEEERQRWAKTETAYQNADAGAGEANDSPAVRFPTAEIVESHVPGSVWKLKVAPGARVRKGDVLVVIESMKMEIAVEAPSSGTVLEALVAEGRPVAAGQALFAVEPER